MGLEGVEEEEEVWAAEAALSRGLGPVAVLPLPTSRPPPVPELELAAKLALTEAGLEPGATMGMARLAARRALALPPPRPGGG